MFRFAVMVLLVQVASVSANTGQGGVVSELLSSARLWIDKKRDDLAALALQKLLRVEANQTDALLMLGEIELRQDHREQAENILRQLQGAHPGHPAGQQLAQAFRIATTERKTMAMIRLLARSGKDEEAADKLRILFPLGNPGGELGMEYQRIMAAANKLRLDAQSGADSGASSDAARFWQSIASANAALENRELPLAEKLAKSALKLFEDDPEALLVLANVYLETDRVQQAEALYRKILGLKPIEDRALRGLIRILAAGGRRPEAIRFIDDFVYAHPESKENFAQAWAGLLRDEADALLAGGQNEQALALLETGVRTLPGQIWLRFDLAGLYKRRGLPQIGRAIMADGAALASDDPAGVYAYALYLSSLGEEEDVLTALRTLPDEQLSDNMKALALKAEVGSRLKRAKSDYLAGERLRAYVRLGEAESLAQNDAALSWDVAEAWIINGEAERGLSLAKHLRRPGDMETTLRYAGFLNDARRDEALGGLLDAIADGAPLDDGQKREVRDLRRAWVLRRSAMLTRQKQAMAARQCLEQGLTKGLENDARLLAALAENLEDGGDLPAAESLYRRLAALNPADYEARLAVARVRIRRGDAASAEDELRRLDRLVPEAAADLRLGVARQFSLLEKHDEARRIAEAVGDAHLGDGGIQMRVGRIEKSAQRYERALQRFELAKQMESGLPSFGLEPSPAAEAIDGVKQRRRGFVTGGFDRRQLSGTPGLSATTNDEYPLLIRQPWGYRGHFFAQLDYSTVSAGKLDLTDFDTAGLFGKVQGLGATHLQGSADQTASGVDFGVGYESDDWRFDLGTTPQGYPVSYAVGGVKNTGNIGDAYYMLDISRRPMTNSLLSYAGAYDPVTGTVWGGVRKSGAEFYGGYDIGRLGLFLQGGAHYLDGENVKSNTSIMGRTGMDWALIDGADLRLTAGVALMYVADANNQQFYTYGHGGYWSPQDYKSVSFPLQWTGRYRKLSYLFRGSASYSMSKQDGADFYPTDNALQASAYRQPLPGGYDRPVYDGGGSTAFGYSLLGALEYQVQDQWFLGGRMELARSPYYTPNYMSLYFRYEFEPRNKPIQYPPKPVKTYDRY